MFQSMRAEGVQTHVSFEATVLDLQGSCEKEHDFFCALLLRVFSAKMGQRHRRDHAKVCSCEIKQGMCALIAVQSTSLCIYREKGPLTPQEGLLYLPAGDSA